MMKIHTVITTACMLGATLWWTACSSDRTPADAAADTTIPLVTSITITGNDRMQFDITRFAVPANTEITLVFDNIGRMPKEAMGHNLAILDKSMDPNVFSAAAIRHPTTEYIPPEYAHTVIATTAILGPGEKETLVFTSPSEPGEYPYVCSFPGHTPAGMKGIMEVR